MKLNPDLLKKVRKDHGLTQQAFADILGITRELVAQMEGGKRSISKATEVLVNNFVTKAKSVTNENFVTNDNQMRLSPQGRVKRRKAIANFAGVPYYDVDFVAGTAETIEPGITEPSYYMDVPMFQGCAAFNVYSDSMAHLIEAGNIMFCSKISEWQSHLEYGQIYAISMTDNRRYLKYIKKSKDDSYFHLVSENDFYDPFDIPKSQIKSIWLVEGWMAKKTQ